MRRLPFKRGFTNIFKIEYQIFNVGDLDAMLEAGMVQANAVISPELLAELGIIRDADQPLAILGDGDLTKPFSFKAHRFSKSAEAKITAAGGSVTKLELLVTGAHATVKLLPKAELEALKAKRQQ